MYSQACITWITKEIIPSKDGVIMTTLNRILWYQNMANADVSAFLSIDEMREYLHRRHPIGKKPAERPETVLETKQ